ncbi:hypothetical protein HZB97_00715 [Candidatus Gottesmanbacteria bacterium]|nr:hypothetical protein [Candidatus Gottesmanbacteria bacterium]
MSSFSFPYITHKNYQIPSIPLELKLGNNWYKFMAYVDSGASYSIFSTRIIEQLGFPYKRGRLIHILVGDGNSIPVWLHQLTIKIGGYQFLAPIGFSNKLGVAFNLLGRAGIFNRFEITFSDSKQLVTFTKI